MKNKRLKKFSTIVLSLLMAVSMMPSMAFAESLPDGADSDGIIYPTVNFTDVAPFLDPVEGVSTRTYARTMARTMSIAPQADNSTTDNGMNISKTATANDDGSYTIQLEAYATGSKVISEVTKDVPTDIVLVLDQSGSMAEKMNTYSFKEYTNKTNSNYYALRHNGGNSNLYYKLEDGSYAPVSVSVEKGNPSYTPISNGKNNSTQNGATSYYSNKDNLYAKVNGELIKVSVEREYVWNWDSFAHIYEYTYTLANGTVIAENSDGDSTSPSFEGIDEGILYLKSVDESQSVYTYTYTDGKGGTKRIGSSTGANTQPSDFVLYESYSTGTTTRLQALKTAVTTFSDNVALKAKGKDGEPGTADDVDHTISVVGFANYSNYDNYNNTEVFIGSKEYKYGANAIAQYSNAPQDMSTETGVNNVKASIEKLSADGATYIDLGLEMANGILEKKTVPAGEKRNRVVIVFTDGVPGYSGEYGGASYESQGKNAQAVADAALKQVETTKNSCKASVYTVGIFDGADATSAGNKDGTKIQKTNWFMQNLSSNNGTVQTPSYYLSAADSNALNNIFQQISNQIESGGSSTTLSSETVIKDIISPQFKLPEGATANNIALETYSCTGVADSGEYTWEKNSGAMGATATVDGDNVSVQGFDFADNYVGTVTENGKTTYRGDKLVISFKVEPKDGFLGGNNVYTNASAGVYENSTAETPVLTFERPQVNVPIEDVTVAATDKNVYLLGSLTAAQLKEGATCKVGDVKLDLVANNFGLADWQTEYVDITVEMKDKDGNVVTDLSDLKDDQKYTVNVVVSPKTAGDSASGIVASEKTADASANVNVFKPVVTFKDSEVYYGEDAPATENYTGNRVSTLWKHGNIDASNTLISMTGTAPDLTFSYEAGTGIDAGKINTKDDIPVDVTTKIGDSDVSDYTTYAHENCNGKTCNIPADKEFLLHVKTCNMIITKSGGAAGEPYVFNIMKDNAPYTTITITGNESKTISELPVGTYTVTEDTNWSWRYDTPVIEVNGGGTLSSKNPTVSFTVKNSINKDKWLNDFSPVIQNVYNPLQTNQQ